MSDLEHDEFYDYDSPDSDGERDRDDEPLSSKLTCGATFNPIPFELGNDNDNDEEESRRVSTAGGSGNVEEVSTGGGGGGCMSTIEEESRTYESTTAPSLSLLSHSRVVQEQEQDALASAASGRKFDAELQELKQFVEKTEARQDEEDDHDPIPSSSKNVDVDVDPANTSNLSGHDVDALKQKLQKLETTQDFLEQILNTGVPDHLDINAILHQLSLDDPLQLASRGAGDGEDPSDRSLSSEIASIQKLMVGVDLTSEGVAGGNNLFQSGNEKDQLNSKARDVEDVLKEYEEFERSISQASASGVDDSFRSDIASLPSASFTTHSNRPSTSAAAVLPIDTSASTSTVPVIKPPVLRTIVPPPPSETVAKSKTSSSKDTNPPEVPSTSNQVPNPKHRPPQEMFAFAPPSSRQQSPSRVTPKSPYVSGNGSGGGGSARTRPVVGSSNPRKLSTNSQAQTSKTSRIETSQSAHGIKPQAASHSARPTTSASTTTTSGSGRDATQDAFKPRNRRMVSPRAAAKQNQNQEQTFSINDMPINSNIGGAGEGYHVGQNNHQQQRPHSHHSVEDKTNNIIAAEALKTIEKLNTMVARQETLLEAYSKDNDRLWTQLREAKATSNEKEAELQDVISSLKTEMSALKLNRLMHEPRQRPSMASKEELQRLREDSEVKSQQITELRRELVLLQSKLSGLNNTPRKQKQETNPSSFVAQEKEKEYQKQITTLNKQVRTLQKILYSKEQTAPPPNATAQTSGSNANLNQQRQNHSRSRPFMQRAQSSDGLKSKSGVGGGNANTQALIKGAKSTGVDSPGLFGKKSISQAGNMNAGEILQASLNCIEQERDEFENVISEKNKVIFEKEKMIINLREQLETVQREMEVPEGELVEPGLIDELRSRIITQNKVIQQLKEHLSTFKRIEAENIILREEKSLLEDQVIELRRKLEFAHNLKKPENEVLYLLSEKVDELNSRYYRRERQLDSLLSRLTLKTTASSSTGVGGIGVGVGVLTSSSTSSSNSSSGSAGISRPLHISTSTSSPRRKIGALDQLNNNNGSLGKTRCGTSSTTIIPSDILHMADFSPSATFQMALPPEM